MHRIYEAFVVLWTQKHFHKMGFHINSFLISHMPKLVLSLSFSLSISSSLCPFHFSSFVVIWYIIRLNVDVVRTWWLYKSFGTDLHLSSHTDSWHNMPSIAFNTTNEPKMFGCPSFLYVPFVALPTSIVWMYLFSNISTRMHTNRNW